MNHIYILNPNPNLLSNKNNKNNAMRVIDKKNINNDNNIDDEIFPFENDSEIDILPKNKLDNQFKNLLKENEKLKEENNKFQKN